MSPIVDEIRRLLPLPVSFVEVDGDGVGVGGENWRLRVNTSWSIVRKGEFVRSSSIPPDESAVHELRNLVGDEIVDVAAVSRDVGLDIKATTRAGAVLEIVSDLPYGEWILSIQFAGNDSHVPVFDLEGPFSPDLV